MMFVRWIVLVLLTAFLNAGCGKPPSPAPAPVTDTDEPRAAQPKLPTIKLWIGPRNMAAELAITDRQKQTGMMFRKTMGENDGMLFVFEQPHRASFWMRNTTVPLDAAYIAPDGMILEIHDLKPLDETSTAAAATDRVQFVLETPQGWFKKNNIGPGVVIATERGSLMQTFFGRK